MSSGPWLEVLEHSIRVGVDPYFEECHVSIGVFVFDRTENRQLLSFGIGADLPPLLADMLAKVWR